MVEHVPLSGNVKLIGGNVAVEIFFMISGFYMALVLDEKYRGRSWHDISSFYLARYLRLWPSFILTTLGVYALWWTQRLWLGREPMSAGPILQWSELWFAAFVRLSNFFMIGQDVPSWFHVSEATGVHLTFGRPATLPDGSLWAGYARKIGPAWSIGTEIWFYLLAPFLLRARSATLVAIAIGGLALRYAMESGYGMLGYFFFPAQLPLFLAGSLAYRASKRQQLKKHAMPVLGLAGGLATVMVLTMLDRDPSWARWLLFPIVALGMPSLFALSQHSTWDRAIGELSYPIYIAHMLVVAVARLVLKRLNVPLTGELAIVLVLPVAYALYYFVERPVDRWRQAFVKRRKRGSGIDAPIEAEALLGNAATGAAAGEVVTFERIDVGPTTVDTRRK